MNTLVSNSLPLSRQRPVTVPSTLAPATRTAIKLLQNIEGGSLRLVLPDGQHIMLGHGAERATLQVNDERVFRRVLAEGDIGFGESWIAGDWHSEHPAELLTLLAENRSNSRAPCMAAGCRSSATACATCCAATPAPVRSATSSPTTTSATISTSSGSTRR
jgi:hypothetical protein